MILLWSIACLQADDEQVISPHGHLTLSGWPTNVKLDLQTMRWPMQWLERTSSIRLKQKQKEGGSERMICLTHIAYVWLCTSGWPCFHVQHMESGPSAVREQLYMAVQMGRS